MMHRGRVKDDDVVGRINQRYVGDPTRKILIVVKKTQFLAQRSAALSTRT